MMKRRILLALAVLSCTGSLLADKKPVKVGLADITAARQQRVTRAADKEGIKATLKYEQIADMKTPRISHQIFPSGDGFVVVGGRTTGFQLTETAELYQNGQWTNLSIGSSHDGAFSVKLSDGRYMIGGGFSSSKGVGQSKATDIYNPSTKSFTTGPGLTVARAMSKAVAVGSKVYVSGNWYADDNVMDLYDGQSFQSVGNMDGRCNPYLFTDNSGNVLVVSAYDTKGKDFGFYTDDDGDQLLLGDYYYPATDETRYFGLPFTPQNYPLGLSDDTRREDYHFMYEGDNCYLLLAKTTTGYMLYLFDFDGLQLYRFNTVEIPTADDAGQTITWRGGIITNQAREEVYLIGASGTATNQTLHIISLNYITDDWTIATAKGFSHNLLTASWTLMADGRLACTGGGIKDNTDAQRKAYIFTPPVAGEEGGEGGDEDEESSALVVTTKDGMQTTFVLLKEKPKVTFSGKDLQVSTSRGIVNFALTDVQRFNYINLPATGIKEVADAPDTDISYQQDEGQLVLSQLRAGAQVGIYTLDGKLVRQLQPHHAGTFRIDLSALPHGVYIVKADTLTYKIIKR